MGVGHGRVGPVSVLLLAASWCALVRPVELVPPPPAGQSAGDVPPIVIMHGILGSAGNLKDVIGWIDDTLPGTYVHNAEIGDGAVSSITMPMNQQVDVFCAGVYADKMLKNGFNLIGFSQGGLIARAYIQRCNKFPVINFLSWNSPQGGQFGGLGALIPDWVTKLLNTVPYQPAIQQHVSLSQYWRDPYNLIEYLEKSEFLADLNNERLEKNATYAKNVASLKGMMLQYSPNDGVISPEISGWFGAFAAFTGPGKDGVVVPMRERLLYTQDFIGLKVLDQEERIMFHTANCTHPTVPTNSCRIAYDEFSLPLLSQTWSEVWEFWDSRDSKTLEVQTPAASWWHSAD